MLDKVTKFMDEKLSMPMARLSEQRHLKAIRDGVIATLPIIIVSSMFLVIAFMPNQLPKDWAITIFIKNNVGKILLPYRMSMFIMTLYAVFGIGYSLSKSYKLDGLSGAILSELAFMLTIVPIVGENGWSIPMSSLGAGGLFVGILASFLAVEIYRITQSSKFKISMPAEVPASVARSFEALTPTILILLIVATISMWLNINIHGIISKLIAPLVHGTDSIFAVIVICLLGMIFWSFGIHGWSIVGTLARPLWITLLDANINAYATGNPIPHIAAEPFYQWFIMIGGAGCTIGLSIAFLLFSKSSYGKALGKTAIIPAIFNINEPMIFGAPIVLNPILIIPFIITPIVCALISWIATSLNLVNKVVASAPWTLPSPIGAYLATGGDYRAIILNILLIVVSVLIYYPFFKMYDNKLLKEEKNKE